MADPLTLEATPGLRVWESEGGHLHRSARGGQPALRAGDASVGSDSPLSRWLPAGRLEDLADDTAGHVELAGVPVCLARSAGKVHALLDQCSHGQVLLSAGDVECWLHGSRFDLVTGRPARPLATAPVPVYLVRINDGVIEVDLPAAPAQQRSSRTASGFPSRGGSQTTGKLP